MGSSASSGIARHDAGTARTAGILVAGARHQLALHLVGAGGIAVLLLLGNAGLERALGARHRAVAGLALALGVGAVVALAFLLVALAGGVGLAEIEIEILDQLARHLGVAVLVGDVAVELQDVAADPALEPGTPELDQLRRGGRRRRAGELLAGQEPHGFRERALAALGETVIALAAVARLQHGGEIAGDAGHALDAERLDPRLLHALEDRARHLALRRAARVQLGVVMLEAKRQRVGGAAHLRRLLLREIARRRRQARARTGEARRLRPVAHGHVVALGDRPQGGGRRALEDLDR